ncbi:MAG: hypothetical protein IV090_17115 [Candidatus Sericytochromatia bacterium]|nr:hypothetical protein [Candidatus Sericytochromatia bacterium]
MSQDHHFAADYCSALYRQDFDLFWRSLKTFGSVSRTRSGHLLALLRGTGFSICDLAGDTLTGGKIDHLRGISTAHLPWFAACLFWEQLTDQVFFSHFIHLYKTYAAWALPHKMDGSCGWAGDIGLANPYAVYWALEESASGYFSRWPARRASHASMITAFMTCSEYHLQILEALFAEKWTDIPFRHFLAALLRDSDCLKGEYGAELKSLITQKFQHLLNHPKEV